MKILGSILMGAALVGAPAAFGQTAPQASPQTTPAPGATAGATAVTDAEVDQYATAALAVNKIQNDTTITAADKGTKMAEAVTATGLTADRFNAISQAMQADPALNQRIQTAAAAKQSATPGGSASTGSGASTGGTASASSAAGSSSTPRQ